MLLWLSNAINVVLPSTRNGKILAAGVTADATGTGMFMAAATLYFVTVIGISPVAAGAALAVGNVCGLLSPVPVGYLADRLGVVRIFIVLLLFRAIGYASYVFASDYSVYLTLTCILTACDRASSPLLQAVVGQVEGQQERTRTMASMRALRNVGMTAGFLLAALVQAIHVRSAFIGLFLTNSVSFLAIAVCLVRITGTAELLQPNPAAKDLRNTVTKVQVRSSFCDTRFLFLTLGESVLSLHDSMLLVLLPLWIVQRTSAPASIASVLLAINTVLTVVLQVYVARFAVGMAGAVRLLNYVCGFLVAA